ncbi:cytochrome C oxidase, Cbb3-type, subunit III [Neisseria elongata subsp. glycolytica ATCC 29315]|uniref:Cytochrome C oxidase, Cbb3-type, subunit III n=1 Tax=Neisseria elongata subsp. glycolytica ATCC 29315 TaxID=546263 RepID=D4DS17_NEIEG|nr:cytochrome C oxidase, Cbb3-type, subunit III [Neisseria elongata subsp. glycolytica ATCC 29315]
MNTTSHFTSDFWNYYIIGIVVLSFIGLIWLLLSQNKVKPLKKGKMSIPQGITGMVLKNTTIPCRAGGSSCTSGLGCSVSAIW